MLSLTVGSPQKHGGGRQRRRPQSADRRCHSGILMMGSTVNTSRQTEFLSIGVAVSRILNSIQA